MRKIIRTLMLAAGTVALVACGGDGASLPTVEVAPTDLVFEVRAEGELVASESMKVALPPSVRMVFNITWMAPEFSEVKAGEVIARFDDVQVRLDREATALDVAKADFRLAGTERTGSLERTRIDHEADRVDGERDISETFADVDQRFFSRNEIIDALADVAYLDVEASFLDWEAQTFDQRIAAEQNLIRAERQGAAATLQKQDTALAMMELRSPADGTFVYATTPWGQKLGKGKQVFAGMPIGLLPVRGKVKARLFVPETDAVGLAPGQTVKLRLDADADREFSGAVENVSPVASPRDRTDPRKFFSVEATIDEVDPDLMRVGSRLRARILTQTIDDGLVVPAQAVYGDAEQAHVFVVGGGDVERRDVRVGRRSPDLVELTAGVAPGERVSLVPPPEASG